MPILAELFSGRLAYAAILEARVGEEVGIGAVTTSRLLPLDVGQLNFLMRLLHMKNIVFLLQLNRVKAFKVCRADAPRGERFSLAVTHLFFVHRS